MTAFAVKSSYVIPTESQPIIFYQSGIFYIEDNNIRGCLVEMSPVIDEHWIDVFNISGKVIQNNGVTSLSFQKMYQHKGSRPGGISPTEIKRGLMGDRYYALRNMIPNPKSLDGEYIGYWLPVPFDSLLEKSGNKDAEGLLKKIEEKSRAQLTLDSSFPY